MSQDVIQKFNKLEVLNSETIKLIQEEKWGAAIAKLDEALVLLSNLDEGFALLPDGEAQAAGLKALLLSVRGDVKSNMGGHKDAIADYDRAIELDSQDAEAHEGRGHAKNKMGDHKGAIADYGRAIELNPQDARTYNSRGTAKDNMGNYEDAIADYDRAIELNPKYAMAYGNRGNTKSKLGNYEDAIADINRAIELNPQDATAYGNLGNTKLQMADYEGSIAAADRAIELNPQDARAYSIRGTVKTKTENFEGAIADYDRALEIDPKYTKAVHNRAITVAMRLVKKGFSKIEQTPQVQEESSAKTPQQRKHEEDIREHGNKSKEYDKKIKFWMAVWAGTAVLIPLASILPIESLASLSLERIMLVFPPLMWHIVALHRSKSRHLRLLEEAKRGLLQAELSNSEGGHEDKRGNANQTADTDGNSPISVLRDIVNRIKSSDKDGD